LLDKYKLTAPSTHTAATAGPDLEKELEGHHIMGFRYTEVRGPRPATRPAPGPRPKPTEDSVKQSAEQMNKWGALTKKHGMKLLYHNHAFEFETLENSSKTQYEILLGETDPALVAMQLDIAWAYVGGQNPLEMFKKNPGRFELWHVKDVKGLKAMDMSVPQSKRRPVFIPIGQGDIDYRPIFAAAQMAGMKYYVIEQDNAGQDGADSMAAAKANYVGLMKVLG
jgi:sugar phosphate isomerase/epimerase